MTRSSLLFHIVRGALVGTAGGLALGLTLIFVMTAQASAQTPAQPSDQAEACQTRESLTRLLEERYAERPVAAGLAAGGRLVELFAAADSVSWTMVATTPAGVSCVIAVGEHWLETKQPVAKGPAA